MAKSAVLKQNQGFLSNLPVGVIIAWHRDLDPATYLPTLPPGWVECNGQTLNDTESPFHGKEIPNLNADPKGENSPGLSRKEQMFLRGGLASGQGQADAFKSHTHTMGTGATDTWQMAAGGAQQRLSHFKRDDYNAGDPKSTDGSGGNETRPANMSVVWIMKVKQTFSVATPAVQAEANAPLGALYIDPAGRLGIGTTTPNGRLHVVGNLALGLDENNKKFIIYPSTDGNGDYLQITHDNATGTRDSSQGITLKRGGNVGIGTTNPQVKLEVAGGLKISSGDLPHTGGSGLRFGNDASGFKWIQSFDSKPLCINPLGNNVGIGTTTPRDTLDIGGVGNSSLHDISVGFGFGKMKSQNTMVPANTPTAIYSSGNGELIGALYLFIGSGGNSMMSEYRLITNSNGADGTTAKIALVDSLSRGRPPYVSNIWLSNLGTYGAVNVNVIFNTASIVQAVFVGLENH